MRVIITNQALDRLEETLTFYIDELGVPAKKVVQIKTQLLKRARSLARNPYKGQYEPYLKKFKKGHRRLIVRHIKIIYRLEEDIIYVTDFFDSRKDPTEMKG